MKKNILYLLFVVIAASCKDDDPTPFGAETQAVLLAGEKNKSKIWVLKSGLYSENGSTPESLFDPIQDACFLDNRYTFTNNDKQEYVGVEGTTKCDPTDPSEMESGNWLFTLDGKRLTVSPSTVKNNDNALFSQILYSATVTKLTATEMVLDYTITGQGASANFKLTFAVYTN